MRKYVDYCKKNALLCGVIIVTAVYIGMLFLINIYTLDSNLNSEIAFEIIFARQIRRDHTLFPVRFFYGYELSALRPAFLAAILDKLFINNAILSYAWALNITLILLVISLIYFLRGLNLQWLEIGIGVLAWLSVPSYVANAYVQYLHNGYFGFYTIVIFLILGIYVRIESISNKHLCLYMVLLGIPSVIYGLMGARMLQMIYLPLFLYEMICLGINIWQKNKVTSRIKHIIFSSGLMAANAAGFGIFTLFLSDRFILNLVPSELGFMPTDRIHDGVMETSAQLIDAMGAYFGSEIISGKGFLYLATMAIAVIIIAATVLIIKYRYSSAAPCIACLSIFITFTICSLTWWKVMARYFMMYSVLLAIVSALIIKFLKEKQQNFYIIFMTIGLIVVALGNIRETYGPMMQVRNEHASADDIIECLRENDVMISYGLRNGLDIGCLTNFEIDSAYVFYNEEENLIYFGNMSSYDPFDYSRANDRCALVVMNSDYEKYAAEWEKNEYFDDVESLEDLGDYKIYIFDYSPFVDKQYMFD